MFYVTEGIVFLARSWGDRIGDPSGGGGAKGSGRLPRRVRLPGQLVGALYLRLRRPEEGHHMPAVRGLTEEVGKMKN